MTIEGMTNEKKLPLAIVTLSIVIRHFFLPLDIRRSTLDTPAMLVRLSPRVALVLLLSINLMNYVDRNILAAVEGKIGRDFHIGTNLTGWLPTAFLLAYMVFAPLFGVLADRMSRWLIVGVGVIAWSLASGGSGAVNSFGLLLMMRLLIGVGEAAYGPVAPTLIADLYPVADRGRVLAWFYAAIPVGSALGYVVGGLFDEHWHWAFYVTVPPGLALGIWALCMRDPRHVNDESSIADTNPAAAEAATPAVVRKATKADYLALLHNRSYVLVTLGMAMMTFAVGGIQFFMPRWLEGRGLSHAAGNTGLGGVIVVAGLVATLLGGWLGDKLRNRFSGSYFLVSGGGMLVSFPLFLLALVTPFPACWALLFLTVFFLFLNTGPTNAIIANVTAPSVRATAFAANIFVIHLLGDAISPPIIGYIANRFGRTDASGVFVENLNAGFMVVSGTIAIGGVLWLLGAKSLADDTARAEIT
ncbi:MAG: MFS transporter [Tepidisphaeraceae bacterium]